MSFYSLTFRARDYDQLTALLLNERSVERAAYLLCTSSTTLEETRLLVRDVIPVDSEDVLCASSIHMEIRPESFMRAMKRAAEENLCFVFAHSHPKAFKVHSAADDATEAPLFRTAYTRIPNARVHASLVFSDEDAPIGRVWDRYGKVTPIRIIRSMGSRFRFFFRDSVDLNLSPFDRQIRAFGGAVQTLLSRLHIGIVGAGGTGSAVAEQLIRLGVGKLSIFDDDTLDGTNVSRVYGSGFQDAGEPKVKLIRRLAEQIGLNTAVLPCFGKVTAQVNARALRNCDIIFGCTDDEWGRSLLSKLAIRFCIPLFDMGVSIDSVEGQIRSVQGRVTLVMPGTSCLFCRERITADQITAEVHSSVNPEGAADLVREGYLKELPTPAPAVIAFTTAVASAAVCELLSRLTGFRGSNDTGTETILFFDQNRIRTNGGVINERCFCQSSSEQMGGDDEPFLGTLWLS